MQITLIATSLFFIKLTETGNKLTELDTSAIPPISTFAMKSDSNGFYHENVLNKTY